MGVDKEPTGMFSKIPPWIMSIVYVFCIPTLVIVFSAKLLDLNPGKYVEQYLNMKFAQMQAAIDASAAKNTGLILQEFNAKFDGLVLRLKVAEDNAKKVPILDMRVGVLEEWACIHADKQGLTNDRPTFCKMREQ